MDLQKNLNKTTTIIQPIPPPREIIHKVQFSDNIDINNYDNINKNLNENEIEILRKIEIPPVIPPPPVPIKSSETAAKAYRTITANNNTDDISIKNVTETTEPLTATTTTTTFTDLANNIKTTSSLENNLRSTATTTIMNLPQFNEKIYYNNNKQQTSANHSEVKLQSLNNTNKIQSEMQSVESELERMFPQLGNANIFDKEQKRFSNIEESTSEHWAKEQQPKRYSNIEIYSSHKENNKKEETHREEQHILSSSPEEKLFKDIEALSKELNQELESGRAQRVEREKSTSLFDIRQSHMKEQFEELKKQRHEHMQELEREIERSMRNRQTKREMSVPLNGVKEKTIPFTVDADYARSTQKSNYDESNEEIKSERTIPFTVDANYAGPKHFEHDHNSPFRRTESMFDLGNRTPIFREHYATRPATASSHYTTQTDDWSQYASDFGNSENIARPFAKEMQICYQRQQPRTIRAPRLSVSNQDLSSNYAPNTYDNYNAYNVQRSQAPLLQQTPPKRQPQHYGSCYSVLERDPNPTYISTTSRRGVSPAPAPPPTTQTPTPNQRTTYKVSSAALNARRASLPREIHEQQLKYISSKEEELRTEFERLQNERKRLMEQLTSEENVEHKTPTSPNNWSHRGAPRLPTLSEDEVFRNQMAEEWLNKVAEREERRLQKIIKISKLHEQQQQQEQAKTDISQEFLKRVHERRNKLDMPADSDWESGAESQPAKNNQNGGVHEIPIKVISGGKSLDEIKELPQHLKEFARYSNEQTEQLANGIERHIKSHEEHSRDVTDNTNSSANKKSTLVKTVKISRLPPQLSAPGKGESITFKTSIKENEITNKDNNNNNNPKLLNHAQLACNTNTNTNTDTNIDIDKLTDTNNNSSFITGSSITGTALLIGLGVLGAWLRLT